VAGHPKPGSPGVSVDTTAALAGAVADGTGAEDAAGVAAADAGSAGDSAVPAADAGT
jgi:hypothetical protein